jgi:hypothetical protein
VSLTDHFFTFSPFRSFISLSSFPSFFFFDLFFCMRGKIRMDSRSPAAGPSSPPLFAERAGAGCRPP